MGMGPIHIIDRGRPSALSRAGKRAPSHTYSCLVFASPVAGKDGGGIDPI
jgi:hypothetical protein